METILLIASMFGLFGALLQFRTIIKVYGYVLYGHFVINLGIAAYLLVKILQASRAARILACQTAIQNVQGQNQCQGLLDVAKWIYLVVAFLVLFIELYGAIVVTRFVNKVEHEKAGRHSSRMDTELAFRVHEHRYAQLHDDTRSSTNIPLGTSFGDVGEEFNPYVEHGYDAPRPGGPSDSKIHALRSNSISKVPSMEEGYGGGTWSHRDFVSDEKSMVQEQESRMADKTQTKRPPSEFDTYETSLYEIAPTSEALDPLLPGVVHVLNTSPTLPTFQIHTPTTPQLSSVPLNTKSRVDSSTIPLILDLRLDLIRTRLRSPTPPPVSRQPSSRNSLPLPNTTSWPLPPTLGLLMQATMQAREARRTRPQPTTVPTPTTTTTTPNLNRNVRMPGGIGSGLD
ncbi:hypothetical protein CVT24_005157 [Panaeolus cyanescens]|uniref:Uncharacterized protein n=1 Tax=Panaeolus cyanescens TaxID=181874 RepID=A0A409VDW4_9AGAR|nr:hypothetical protein CVT24_005157 [Panaeolus cyanescens]